jgi:hypothetical protein
MRPAHLVYSKLSCNGYIALSHTGIMLLPLFVPIYRSFFRGQVSEFAKNNFQSEWKTVG